MGSRLRGSTLALDCAGARVMLVEMLADDLQILGVRPPEKVEDIAGERDRAERGVDADIGRHASQLQL